MPLEVRLLPTSLGDHSQNQSLTTFIVNETIAIDAGSLGFALTAEQLTRVGHVIITHSHLDHVASLPIAIAEVFPRLTRPMRVYATPEVLGAVRAHLLNGVIWPDFSRIKMIGVDEMAIEFVPIHPNQTFEIDGVKFTPVLVNHEVQTIGLIVETSDAAVAFTSDTCCTDEIWAAASRRATLQAVFVDCSFPNEMEELAIQSGHLTPKLVAAEADKLTRPAQIICVHIKPASRDQVLHQIDGHYSRPLIAVEIGKTYRFDGTSR